MIWRIKKIEIKFEIRTTYGVNVVLPVLVTLNNDLHADVWAVFLEELAKHLTLKQGDLNLNWSQFLLTSGKNGWVALLAIT